MHKRGNLLSLEPGTWICHILYLYFNVYRIIYSLIVINYRNNNYDCRRKIDAGSEELRGRP